MKFDIIQSTTLRTICLPQVDDQLCKFHNEKAFTGNSWYPKRGCFGSAEKITVRAFSFGVVMQKIHLENQTFGQLTVIAQIITPATAKKKRTHWICKCECGNTAKVSTLNLRSGKTKSCGCFRNRLARERLLTHGYSATVKRKPEYVAYNLAKSRCNNSNHPDYPNYGGRGICFKFASFEEFIAELGDKPTPKHSIDRKNTDGHYEKGNVQWATRQQQNRNKRSNVFVTIAGQTKLLIEWADAYKIDYGILYHRYRSGFCERCFLKKGKNVRCKERRFG